MAYLEEGSISEGCRGQGDILRNRPPMPVPGWNPLPPMTSAADMRSRTSAAEEVRPSFLGGGVCSNGTNWRSSLQPAALEVATRAMPRRSRNLKRSSRKVPEVDVYLTDRTRRRTAAGAQLNPAGEASGAVHCFPRRRLALYSLRLLRIGSAPRSLVICGLPTSPGDVVRWPASTNSRRDDN